MSAAALSPRVFRKTQSLFKVANEQVRVAEFVAYIPDWNLASHSSGRMNNLTHGYFRNRIRDYLVSVIVYHRANVPPAPINRAMNWTLTVHCASALIDWITIQIKFHNIIQTDKFGAAGA